MNETVPHVNKSCRERSTRNTINAKAIAESYQLPLPPPACSKSKKFTVIVLCFLFLVATYNLLYVADFLQVLDSNGWEANGEAIEARMVQGHSKSCPLSEVRRSFMNEPVASLPPGFLPGYTGWNRPLSKVLPLYSIVYAGKRRQEEGE